MLSLENTSLNSTLTIDEAMGEGGGQILRTALSLSLCLQRPIHIRNIRSQRRNPGMQRQHLAAVEAARAIGMAEVNGATFGSRELLFSPHGIETGAYRFDIGTAGSTGLVLQTLFPALITAREKSELQITGGTHNPFAPSFDFLNLSFIPLLERMGSRVTLTLKRHGFYPAGGGVVKLRIQPQPHLEPLQLLERGEVLDQYATILLSHLPEHIAQGESQVIAAQLGIREERILLNTSPEARGPGNVAMVIIKSEQIHGCPVRQGAGVIVEEPCTKCGGGGYMERESAVRIHIPPGDASLAANGFLARCIRQYHLEGVLAWIPMRSHLTNAVGPAG